jgi:hypothetical protein
MIEQFDGIENMCDRHVKRYKYSTYVHTGEIDGAPQKAMIRGPTRNVRCY